PRTQPFSVGQFCDGGLEVSFRSKTCYVRNLEGEDLLTGARESNLYTISIFDMTASLPICILSKATSIKSWLWHRRISHLNFGTINDLTKHDLVDGLPKFKYSKDHLCSAYERGKSKKSSHQPKLVPSTHSKLKLLHMDLCGPMRVSTINGKKYILVIVDDYSRFTWFDELTTMASEHDRLEPVSQRFINDDSSTESMNTLFKEDLDNLFGPMYEEYFKKRSFEEASPIVTTSEEQTSAILNEADELNQEESAEFDGNTLLTPYDTLSFDESESSTTALDPSNMHEFHQVQPITHIWIKARTLEQVISNPSKPVMTQKRLQTDSELCMYALTVSTVEPKNIKEAMLDHNWREIMQDELHQFKRLDVWELVPIPDGKNIIAFKWL
ncbi:retrovirus-related pol polyprotein from transposon TNT 1-94, partial [Tanacetum coccineum]